jgi:glyoxylate/hydroxypyruvate reductase
MAIALLIGRDAADKQRHSFFINSILNLFAKLRPELDVRVYPNLGNVDDIDFAIVWRHPLGVFSQLPKLQCIAAFSAGVDHLFADTYLPANIPIVRITDPAMSVDITQYVVAAVLYWLKRFDHWQKNQTQQLWEKIPPFSFADKTVGVMGMGFLGKHAAQTLQALNVKVIGWSLSPKNLPGITHFAGKAEFPEFLANSHALVCLLPLTPDTRNILNAALFAQLPRGAYLINIGRGEQLVEADLLNA